MLAAAFLGDVPFFALADGTVHRLDHGHKIGKAHDGLLAAVLDPANDAADHRRRGRQGLSPPPPTATSSDSPSIGRKWITSVAAGPQGAIAYATGKNAYVRFADGKTKEFQHPRSVEGLAFSPKGMRFGVARYNGVTLHFPAADGKPVDLNGTAPIPASPSRPMALSSSPPCRKTRCMAGSSPTASTCA